MLMNAPNRNWLVLWMPTPKLWTNTSTARAISLLSGYQAKQRKSGPNNQIAGTATVCTSVGFGGGQNMDIRIVTDSACDLPDEIIKEQDITVVPLYINVGEQSYLDGVDLTREEFYRNLPSYASTPKT